MSPADAILFAKLMAAHDDLGGEAIILTVAFTPGSLSLSAHVLTPKGFEYGRSADINNPTGYNPATMTDRAQLLLSDRIYGSTFAPMGGVWNYGLSLSGQWSPTMPYSVTLVGSLLGFWSHEHRTQHFSAFIAGADEENGADLDNNFA